MEELSNTAKPNNQIPAPIDVSVHKRSPIRKYLFYIVIPLIPLVLFALVVVYTLITNFLFVTVQDDPIPALTSTPQQTQTPIITTD